MLLIWSCLTLRGHEDGVTCVAFSADGRQIVSGSVDRSVRVWDAETGKEAIMIRGTESEVRSVAFSLDGRRIVSRDKDEREITWDSATGKRVEGGPSPTTLTAKTSSSDGYLWGVPNVFNIDIMRINRDFDLWAEDAARRAAWEPIWCERDAAECESAENWFAACFHLRRLSQLKPDGGNVKSRLENAEAKLVAESKTSTSDDSEK